MLLLMFGVATFASTLLGGMLAIGLRDRLHLILGFSAGAVIGVSFFDLLPEAIELGGGAPGASRELLAWAALGFLAYLLLDRMLGYHRNPGRRASAAAAVLCTHSLLDGIAIGLAFQASHPAGVAVAIAVLAHDFSDGINTLNVVLKNGGSRSRALRWLALDALAPVAGIAATRLFELPAAQFGPVLALFAGFFLYIGASDLIPESYHAHPKFLTTAMTVAGATVLYLAGRLIG